MKIFFNIFFFLLLSSFNLSNLLGFSLAETPILPQDQYEDSPDVIPVESTQVAPLLPPEPWFTGPIIAPAGTVVPLGNFEFEAFLFLSTTTGVYNRNWDQISSKNNFFSVNPEFYFYLGLTPWADINLVLQFFYNTVRNQNHVNFGDTTVALDLQLLPDDYTPYFPGIKFTLRETFPTGPYQNLNPKKLLTDLNGGGTYATGLNLVFYKVFNVFDAHFLTMTLSSLYTISAPFDVKGFNLYGGGRNAKGKVYPGNQTQIIASFEYSLSQNIVLSLDNIYTHTNKTSFKGYPGTIEGILSNVSAPSSESISFCPALEYNFSSNLGINTGCYFSAFGRNSQIFRTFATCLVATF
jgi:hypothetical protein